MTGVSFAFPGRRATIAKKSSPKEFFMRLVLSLVLSLALSGPGWAVETAQMRDLLRLMGFDVAMDAVGPSIRRGKSSINGTTEEFNAVWDRTVEEFFPAGKLFEAHARAIAPELTDAEWSGMMDYFSEGLGRRVTDMENAAQAPEAYAQKQAEAPALVERLKEENPRRLEQIDEMMRVMSTEEEALAHTMNMSFAMIVGLVSAGQAPARMGERQILEMLQAQAPEMRKNIRKGAIENNAYTYRDLTNAELDAYIAFLKSPPARKLYQAMQDQNASMMPTLVRAFGRAVMKKMGMSEL